MSCSFNSVTRCLSILLTSDNNITGAGHSRRSLARQAGLGDAQGGDVEELLEADIAAALDTEAALLHAAEDLSHPQQVLSGGERKWVAAWVAYSAGAAAGVGVDAANAGLDARGELGTLLQVVRPDLGISQRALVLLRANHSQSF